MAVFTGLGAGTELDPYQITTVAQFKSMNAWGVVAWFKLMNDIDFGGLTGLNASFDIQSFTSHLDGNNKEVQNLTVGNTWMMGFWLMNGCSIKNLTFRVTNSVNIETVDSRLLFYPAVWNLSNVSLTGIKVFTSGTGSLTCFAMSNFQANCTLKNIVLEGNFKGIFPCGIYCTIEGVKVLRMNALSLSDNPSNNVPIVGETLFGEMKFCQMKFTKFNFDSSTNPVGFLVRILDSHGIITQSFVDGEVITNNTGSGNITSGLVGMAQAPSYDWSKIEDCYFKGKLATIGEGGTISNYAIADNTWLSMNRCIANVNFVSAINNRPFLISAGNNYSANNFYNKAPLLSFTPVDVANRQTGLTAEEFLNPASFTGFDFVNTWKMEASGPELINNPPYAFETSLKNVLLTSFTRLSGTLFNVVIDPVDVVSYGVEVYEGETLIFSSADTAVNVVTIPLTDAQYIMMPFYWNGTVKIYTPGNIYAHYCYDMALSVSEYITPTAIVTLTNPTPADFVHGSLIHDGFIYGSTRGTGSNPGAIIKAPVHNIAAYINIEIRTTSKTNAEIIADGKTLAMSYMQSMDQIVLCGGYIYASGFSGASQYLVQLNPADNSYKIFKMSIVSAIAPIFTDGEFLYFANWGTDKTYKVLASQFIGNFPQFNVDVDFPVIIAGTYDMSTQGGYISGGYTSKLKGECHSAVTDDQFLYIAFTTDRGTNQGYYAPLNISTNELHKVRKSDMTAAGFVKIPKSTDDCAQNEKYIFFGIEVAEAANLNTFGYNWGTYAVRKSDLHLTALPRFSLVDQVGFPTSYASLLFGNYLMDIRSNGLSFIIDISDVDSWLITEPIGKRTIKSIGYIGLNISPNEILLDSDGSFYSFAWGAPAKLAQFTIPSLDFFAVPTITTMDANAIDSTNIIISGFILNNGGKPITEKGFKYGLNQQTLTKVTSTENTPEFHAVLNSLAPGNYFYKAYAQNIYGESTAEIKTFSIASKFPVFYDGVRIKTVMYNNIEIKALNF